MKNRQIKVEAYTYANYAENIDDRKFISSFCTYLGDNIMTDLEE